MKWQSSGNSTFIRVLSLICLHLVTFDAMRWQNTAALYTFKVYFEKVNQVWNQVGSVLFNAQFCLIQGRTNILESYINMKSNKWLICHSTWIGTRCTVLFDRCVMNYSVKKTSVINKGPKETNMHNPSFSNDIIRFCCLEHFQIWK